jgi:hypothetical protein
MSVTYSTILPYRRTHSPKKTSNEGIDCDQGELIVGDRGDRVTADWASGPKDDHGHSNAVPVVRRMRKGAKERKCRTIKRLLPLFYIDHKHLLPAGDRQDDHHAHRTDERDERER